MHIPNGLMFTPCCILILPIGKLRIVLPLKVISDIANSPTVVLTEDAVQIFKQGVKWTELVSCDTCDFFVYLVLYKCSTVQLPYSWVTDISPQSNLLRYQS